MLSPQGLEAKILASMPQPRSFGLGLKHLVSAWPHSR